MSTPPRPDAMTTAMTQLEDMTKAYRQAVPSELATAVNLMAHPVAGFAAAGAIGLGVASHAMGLWLGAVAGMAEASQKLLADAAEAPRPVARTLPPLKLVASTPAPKAASTAAAVRTLAADAGIVARAADEALTDRVVATTVASVAAPRPPRAKAGAADDLKAISGIGPKLEKVLNGLGIFTYEQVARMTKVEIAALDDKLGFAGRIERDDWIGQASKLKAGK
jgi:NADH-quinone oxidoreductase subunit E